MKRFTDWWIGNEETISMYIGVFMTGIAIGFLIEKLR